MIWLFMLWGKICTHNINQNTLDLMRCSCFLTEWNLLLIVLTFNSCHSNSNSSWACCGMELMQFKYQARSWIKASTVLWYLKPQMACLYTTLEATATSLPAEISLAVICVRHQRRYTFRYNKHDPVRGVHYIHRAAQPPWARAHKESGLEAQGH